MNGRLPYRRFLVLALAGMFSVASIGLPVVIDLCPMPKAPGSAQCPLCGHPQSHSGKTTIGMKSCCEVRSVGEKNSAEYTTPDVRKHLSVPVLLSLPVLFTESLTGMRLQSSLLSSIGRTSSADNLPIQLSCLLI